MSNRITYFLSAFLAEKGTLSLPGFGVISFDKSLASDASPDFPRGGFPPGSLSFQPLAKASWDEELITMIAGDTGKMRSLIISDLESFLQFGHELTNMSKPFQIEGIGWVQKDHLNEVSFMQEDVGGDASTSGSKRTSGKIQIELFPWRKVALWLGVAILAATLYWAAERAGLFTSFQEWRNAPPPSIQPSDTPKIKPSNPSPNNPATPSAGQKDLFPFSVVLEVSPRKRALKRYAQLMDWHYNVRLSTKDSITFKLFIPIQAPLSDTARYRDSLSNHFDRKVWIETHPDE